jgi:hypothetical protein
MGIALMKNIWCLSKASRFVNMGSEDQRKTTLSLKILLLGLIRLMKRIVGDVSSHISFYVIFFFGLRSPLSTKKKNLNVIFKNIAKN